MNNWDAIRQEWETTKISLAKLAEKHGVALGTIKSRCRRDGWTRNEIKMDASKTKTDASKKKVDSIGIDARPDVGMVIEAFAEETETNAELSDVQRMFCLEYVKCLNATKAYQKVYETTYDTANANGPRLIVNASIRAEITRLKKARAAGMLLDKNDVLQQYIDIAFASIDEFIEYGTEDIEMLDFDGNPMLDEDGYPKTYKRSYVRLKDGANLDSRVVSEIKQGKDGVSVKLYDKLRALDVLARFTNLLDEEDLAQVKLEREKCNLTLQQMEIERQKREEPTGTESNKYAYMTPEQRVEAIARLKGMKANDR